MDDLLHQRILRSLEGLEDDEARKVLDYVEFLQTKYGKRSSQPSVVERIADGVEDTLRVGKVPFVAIKGTRSVLDTADKLVKGVTDAGRAVVDEIQSQFEKTDEETKARGEDEETEKQETGDETREPEDTESDVEKGDQSDQ